MLQTSDLYKQAMAATGRGIVVAQVRCGAVDMDAAETISNLFASQPEYYSENKTFMYEDGIPAKTYATAEPGRIKLDGSQIIASKTELVTQGYVSACLSNADSIYETQPYIEFVFAKTHTCPGLTLGFDVKRGEYAAELKVEAWRGSSVLFNQIVRPDKAEWQFVEKLERFDKLRLTFIRSSSPYRRGRLQQIKYGIGFILAGNEIITVQQISESDPLSRRLPLHNLRINANNTNGLYDPDNPTAFSDMVERYTPIEINYKLRTLSGLKWSDLKTQTLAQTELATILQVKSGGYRMFIKGGKYFLTATPVASGKTVIFSASGPLGFLNKPYNKCRLERNSLYNIALEIFSSYTVPFLDNGKQALKLWEGLKDIYTDAPLPKESGANLLQLIANAACCAMYTDRDGYLCIMPPPEEQHSLKLDEDTQMPGQTVSKGALIRSVACKYYQYTAAAEETELFNSSFNVNGISELFIDFSSASTGITVDVTGAEFSFIPYVYGVQLKLIGNGIAAVVIKGKALKSTSSTVYVQLPGADDNGEIETLENPLITLSSQSRMVGTWVSKYLNERNSYHFDYRGEPAIDVLDNVYSQSKYSAEFPARVLRHEITYDGIILGKAVLKRR